MPIQQGGAQSVRCHRASRSGGAGLRLITIVPPATSNSASHNSNESRRNLCIMPALSPGRKLLTQPFLRGSADFFHRRAKYGAGGQTFQEGLPVLLADHAFIEDSHNTTGFTRPHQAIKALAEAQDRVKHGVLVALIFV